MFTGIVREVGRVVTIDGDAGGIRLELVAHSIAANHEKLRRTDCLPRLAPRRLADRDDFIEVQRYAEDLTAQDDMGADTPTTTRIHGQIHRCPGHPP